MATKQSIGTANAQSIVFNSGFLTVNGTQITDISEITISSSFTLKDFRTLNSIKKRALRRATLDQTVACKLTGGKARAIYSLFYSSSSPVSGGTEFDVLDGQQTAAAVYITCYEDDNSSKAYQYQLVNPVLSKMDEANMTEEFSEVGLEFGCTDVVFIVDTAVSN